MPSLSQVSPFCPDVIIISDLMYIKNGIKPCCCLCAVLVPEEHQDLPDGVLRGLRYEEERAVRGFRPVRRARLRQGEPRFTFSEQCVNRKVKSQTKR